MFLWQRNGTLLEVVEAHTKSVNCIKWNKGSTDEMMFASCGDDHQVILWQTVPPQERPNCNK